MNELPVMVAVSYPLSEKYPPPDVVPVAVDVFDSTLEYCKSKVFQGAASEILASPRPPPVEPELSWMYEFLTVRLRFPWIPPPYVP
jgi:hypothetical protein